MKILNPTISIFNLKSDGSALVHVQTNQTFYIEYHPEMTRRSISKINYLVERRSVLYFPTDVVIMGLNTPAVELQGSIVGALNVTVAEGRTFNFDPKAKTEPPPSKNSSEDGLKIDHGLEMGIWTQEANSKLMFTGTGDCYIQTSDLILRSGASLEAKVTISKVCLFCNNERIALYFLSAMIL